MLKRTVLSVAVLSSLFAGTVFAAGSHTAQNDHGHFYGTVQLGYGGMDLDNSYSYTNSRIKVGADKTKKNGLAYRLAGGYLFKLNNQWELGPELGFESYAKNEYDLGIAGAASGFNVTGTGTAKVEGFNIDLLLNAHYHFNNNLYAIGKVGAAYVSEKGTEATILSITGQGQAAQSASGTDHAVLAKLGLGLGYDINTQLSADFTVNSTFGGTGASDITSDKPDNVRTYLLGLSYHF